MNKQHKLIKPLTGHFLGWGDDTTPHRYIKLATTNGERLVKVAKSLRPQIQDWQPGLWLALLSQERIDLATGEIKIKVKQLLTPPRIHPSPTTEYLPVSIPVEPTKIRVCQGSSCRRRGSDKICQSMQGYIDRNDLTEQVVIETVKCLHQCKAAPHAIVSTPVGGIVPGKTHYRQLQSSQVKAIFAKHFPIATPSKSVSESLIEKIGDYLKQHRISISNTPS